MRWHRERCTNSLLHRRRQPRAEPGCDAGSVLARRHRRQDAADVGDLPCISRSWTVKPRRSTPGTCMSAMRLLMASMRKTAIIQVGQHDYGHAGVDVAADHGGMAGDGRPPMRAEAMTVELDP